MWLAGPSTDESDEWAAELEMGAGGWHPQQTGTQVDAGAGDPAEPVASADDVEERLGAVAAEEGWDEAEVQAVRAYLSGVMARDAGVAAAATPSAPERAPTIPSEFDLPGAEELDEAMTALSRPVIQLPPAPPQVLPESPEPPEPAAPPPVAEADDPETPAPHETRMWSKFNDPGSGSAEDDPRSRIEWPGLDQEYRVAPPTSEAPSSLPRETAPHAFDPPAASEPEPEWLRGRQDAAARAYRRLRRILPNPER